MNPILGDHPSTAQVDRFFAGSWLLKTGITWALPTEYRGKWQWFCISVSAFCVLNNYTVGVNGEW